MTKRKDERRELLREDEFHSVLDRVAKYIQENQQQVFGISTAVILVLALIFGGLAYLDSQKNEKAASLYEAEKIMGLGNANAIDPATDGNDAERLQDALTKIDGVIASETGVVRTQALIYKVGLLVDLGRQDEIEAIYEEIAKSGGDLRFFGVIGLGDLFLENGRFDDAMSNYNQVLAGGSLVPDNMEDWVKFKIAKCYKGKGELPQARTELTELINKYANQSAQPPIIQPAKDLLAEMDGADAGAADKNS